MNVRNTGIDKLTRLERRIPQLISYSSQKVIEKKEKETGVIIDTGLGKPSAHGMEWNELNIK